MKLCATLADGGTHGSTIVHFILLQYFNNEIPIKLVKDEELLNYSMSLALSGLLFIQWTQIVCTVGVNFYPNQSQIFAIIIEE